MRFLSLEREKKVLEKKSEVTKKFFKQNKVLLLICYDYYLNQNVARQLTDWIGQKKF